MAKLKYTDEFPVLAEKYMREGLTEAQAAHNLGVSVATFESYKHQYPEFLAAIKSGKAPVDFDVENALLKRAMGYTYEEKSTVTKVDARGEGTIAEVKKIVKHVPADTTAQIFWLKNRRPDRWRDVKAVEVTGKDGEPINAPKIDMSKLSTATLMELKAAYDVSTK